MIIATSTWKYKCSYNFLCFVVGSDAKKVWAAISALLSGAGSRTRADTAHVWSVVRSCLLETEQMRRCRRETRTGSRLRGSRLSLEPTCPQFRRMGLRPDRL